MSETKPSWLKWVRLGTVALIASIVCLFVYCNEPQAAETCPSGCVSATPPTCAQRVARAKAAGCVIPCAEVPCSTGNTPGAKGEKGDKGDPGAIAPVSVVCAPMPCNSVAVPCATPKEHVRPILGVGLDYDFHNLQPNVPRWGAHAFTGVQFPKDHFGHNSQVQVGISTHHTLELVPPPPPPPHHGHGDGGNTPPTAVDPTVRTLSVSYVVVF